MRRVLLQGLPDGVSDHLLIASQRGVPEAQHRHPVRLQKCIAKAILLAGNRMAVLPTVEFDIDASLDAVEIEDVSAKWVLATELVT